MRFVLLKGQSQHGSLRMHTDQLAAALDGLGHETQVVDLVAPDGVATLAQTTDSPPDAYIGFSGVGADFKAGGVSVYDHIGSAYVGLNVDHPVYHLPRLAEPICRYSAFFLDQTPVKLMTAWPPRQKLAHVGFLPPGANELAEPLDTSDESLAARDIAARFLEAFGSIDVRHLLGQVRCPTLVMHAKDDRRIPLSAAGALAAGIPGAELVTLDSDSHLLLGREPASEVFVAQVRDFVG